MNLHSSCSSSLGARIRIVAPSKNLPTERRVARGGKSCPPWGGDRGPFLGAAVVVLRGAHRFRKKLRCRRGIAHRQDHTLRRV